MTVQFLLIGIYILYLLRQNYSDVRTCHVCVFYDIGMALLATIYGVSYTFTENQFPWGLFVYLILFGSLTKLKLFGLPDLLANTSMYFILNQPNKYFLIVTILTYVLSNIIAICLRLGKPIDGMVSGRKYYPYFPYITMSFIAISVLSYL